MIAPEWVCRELERINPRVRLGWAGREPKDGELNAGTFMLLELVQSRRRNATFRTAWDDRGPIYGSAFDRLMMVPLMVYDIAPEDVFSGAVVSLLRRWMTPIKPRLEQTEKQQRAETRAEIREMAEAAGSEMYWKAQRGLDDGAVPIRPANKFLTQKEKDLLTGDWERKPEPETHVSPLAVV